MLLFTKHAKVVGVTRGTRAPSTSHGAGRGVGAVVVDVGPDQHQALRHAERKAQTYGKALVCLASLLCLSVCANLASSALTVLVFNESRTRGAIQPALSDSKPATPPVGTGLTPYVPAPTGMSVPPFEVPTLPQPKDKPSDPKPAPVGATPPAANTGEVSTASVPGMKRCAIAPSGTEACWELADPSMTDIPDYFLQGGNKDLTGALKVGPAVKTIGASAFANTKLTGLDLSEATSLVEIGKSAFSETNLAGTLMIPSTVTKIGNEAFANTKLGGLDLSKATSLVEI